eukprot:Blabericola_migrator_1__13208@NODE_911_length_6105_cov_137_973501_g636_i0_p3_GENE_NODE_911_length_6105_cov_137_973501_g636_i0NODE_911_length_6105_cov_137_973501_g636_i0_p3_ORF_typecomplete_len512_score70_27AAA/PF00004_29/1_1e05AAA/PF00004_29/2_6e06NACHT/PF05729_12/0_00016NACHT/PF05729_12/3_2e03AAA_16/PF13191_6/0_013AAA_16/PF13191_6/18AAA_22/PF13401_6/0_0041AAA_22/PF13401_6/4_2e03AAA_22/PF13401_6/9_2e02AAA_14/PF13173_6/0_00058IstB_IS21/PF01695_17/0_0052AAA_25/PF13481_6/0_025AAA_5/PF07728_14/0_013
MSLVLLEGDPGVGKTFTARALVQQALSGTGSTKYFPVSIDSLTRSKEASTWLTATHEDLTKRYPHVPTGIIIDNIEDLFIHGSAWMPQSIRKQVELFFDVLTLYCARWRKLENVEVIILVVGSSMPVLKDLPVMQDSFWSEGFCKIQRVPDLDNSRRQTILKEILEGLDDDMCMESEDKDVRQDALRRLMHFPNALTGLTCHDLVGLAHHALNNQDVEYPQLTFRKNCFEIHQPQDLLELEVLTPMDPLSGPDALIGRTQEFKALEELVNKEGVGPRPIGILLEGTSGFQSLILRLAEHLRRPVLTLSAATIFQSMVGASERLFYELSELLLKRSDLIVIFRDVENWVPAADATSAAALSSTQRMLKAIGDVFTSCELKSPPSVDCQRVIIGTTSDTSKVHPYLLEPHLFGSNHIHLDSMTSKFRADPCLLDAFIHLYLKGRVPPTFDWDAVTIAFRRKLTHSNLDPASILLTIQEAAIRQITLHLASETSEGIALMDETIISVINKDEGR